MSWNIDGLADSDETDMLGRTMWVVKEVNEYKPDVVFFQELIDFNFHILSSFLGTAYHVYRQQSCNQPYFVSILVHKKRMQVVGGPLSLAFTESKMGRGLVYIAAKPAGSSEILGFMTSHLESMKEYFKERQSQFTTCLAVANKLVDENGLTGFVFGGDLNIRDNEVPREIRERDMWILAGRDRRHEHTWDLSRNDNATFPNGAKPKCRFDRLYLVDSGMGWSVQSFTLVGTSRVEGLGRFASDHFGILSEISAVSSGK
jgi:tyrosyl-DNA phosphodiesterase 2